MRTVVFTTLALVVTLIDAACSPRERPATDAAHHALITGELRADGSCAASVDGDPLFTSSDSARGTMTRGSGTNVAPPGHELLELWCSPGDTRASSTGPQGERALLITLYPRPGTALPPGHYPIVREVPTAQETTAAGIAVFGAPQRTSTAGHAGVAYLAGDSGGVTISRVDGAGITATFSARASPAWTM